MPIIPCPHCAAPVDIHADDAGYKVLCPECHSAFQAGDSDRPAPAPLVPPPAASRAREGSSAVLARCPACRGQVQIDGDDVGHLMVCPLCGEKFRAAEERDTESRPARSRSAVGSRRDEDNDDDDDEDYDDRRNRRRYREEDKGYIVDSARAAIAWPANGLMWTGIVCSVLCFLIAAGLGVAGIVEMDDPDPYSRKEYVLLFIYAGAVAFGIPYHMVLAFAGYEMKKLRGTGWAYTGAALGIATIIFSGACSPTTWVCMTFAIWTLVAYSKREVQDAIRINQGRSP